MEEKEDGNNGMREEEYWWKKGKEEEEDWEEGKDRLGKEGRREREGERRKSIGR